MIKVTELIDFCFLYAPPGFAQDSNDQDHAKELATRSEINSLVFSYSKWGYTAIFIRLPVVTIELYLDLTHRDYEIRPFLEFAEKLRVYVSENSIDPPSN
jgi:hypothetical protein